jgi:hypothetical protein
MKVLLRDQRRRIRIKCEEYEMNRSQTEDLSLALPLEQVGSISCTHVLHFYCFAFALHLSCFAIRFSDSLFS